MKNIFISLAIVMNLLATSAHTSEKPRNEDAALAAALASFTDRRCDKQLARKARDVSNIVLWGSGYTMKDTYKGGILFSLYFQYLKELSKNARFSDIKTVCDNAQTMIDVIEQKFGYKLPVRPLS